MPKRVLVFLSEILSAKTLTPLIHSLRRDSNVEVSIVNDGFCVDFVRSLNLPFDLLQDNFGEEIVPFVENADLVITGKSYEQPSEYILIKEANSRNVPLLLVIPDMGVDVVKAKLRGLGDESENGEIPIPVLVLADPMTKHSLIELGVPEHRLIEGGNPYFDELYQALSDDSKAQNPVGVGYFSTPFELDWSRGILPAEYRQADLIQEIRDACHSLGVQLMGKRHPQVEPVHFGDMELFEGTPLEMLRKIQVSVGSYSTTLLESYVAGIPTISYQPWKTNIRADVFDGRIPIATSPEELCDMISAALGREARLIPGGNVITYNPGSSLQVYLDLAREILGEREPKKTKIELNANSRRNKGIEPR